MAKLNAIDKTQPQQRGADIHAAVSGIPARLLPDAASATRQTSSAPDLPELTAAALRRVLTIAVVNNIREFHRARWQRKQRCFEH